MLGDTVALGGDKLHYLRVRTRQVAHIEHTRVKQHLVDIRRGDGLLVEHRTDIQCLRHRDIVDVLHLRDGLLHPKPLCCEAGKDIRLAAVGYCDEGVRVLYAFLLQGVHIATVCVDNQRVIHLVGDMVAEVAVGFQYLDAHALRQFLHGFLRYARSTIDDDVLYLAFLLAGMLAERFHVLACANGIDHIAHHYLVVAAWDDGVLPAFDSHHAIQPVSEEARQELLSQYLRALAHFDDAEFQRPIAECDVIAQPIDFQRFLYLVRRQHLRIDKVIEPHLLEDTLVLGDEVLVVIYPREGLFHA